MWELLGDSHIIILTIIVTTFILLQSKEVDFKILWPSKKTLKVDLFPKDAEEIAHLPSDLVVSNVWGPAQTEGPAREKYFYSFTDAKTRYSMVYFGNTKDETLKNFETFKNFIETQTRNKVKRFRSDNGGEYTNKSFKEYL